MGKLAGAIAEKKESKLSSSINAGVGKHAMTLNEGTKNATRTHLVWQINANDPIHVLS